MIRSTKLRSLSCLSLLAVAASAQGQDAWIKHFRIGMSFGLNIKTDFKTTGTFPISGSAPGDPTNAFMDHFYDDGYVRLDDTGNARDPDTGIPSTAFWGYQSASQLTGAAPNQTLTYHSSKFFTGSGNNSADASPALGFDMAYGGTFAKWERLAVGWEFGFNLTTIGAKDRQPIAATLTQGQYQFGSGGTTPMPAAPYNGTFVSAGNPLINAVGTALPDLIVPGTINGTRSLDALLYQFRLGPQLRWEFYPQWTLNGSFGGAFGLVDADYRFDEKINLANGTTASNRGKFGSLETTYGGYAGAVVMFDTGNRWEAYLGTHFITMSDAKVTSGNREAKMGLGGAVYISAGINWTF
jgi:hypothetical protein